MSKLRFALSIAIVLPLLGCGPARLSATDDRLEALVGEFRQEALNRGITLNDLDYLTVKVVAGFQTPNRLGVCIHEDGTNELGVKVDRKRVEISATTVQRGDFILKFTIFHELGHCLLNLEHSDGVINVSVNRGGVSYSGLMPMTIMNSISINESQIPVARLYWSEYIDVLFGLATNPFNPPIAPRGSASF
jgi:hypothetical protein